MNDKYQIRFEAGPMEQIFKIAQTEVKGIEGIHQLVDEAFLRRIRYKIQIEDPSWDDFREIFKRVAENRGIPYSEDAFRRIVVEYYVKLKRKPRAVHPRDILDELLDIARYRNVPPTLSNDLVDLACQAYFLKE